MKSLNPVKRLSHCSCYKLSGTPHNHTGWFERLLLAIIPHFDITKEIVDACGFCEYCDGSGKLEGLWETYTNEAGELMGRTTGKCPRCISGMPRIQVIYLRRFYLFRAKWFGSWLSKFVGDLYLHHIVRSDDDPDPHDHPWGFVGLILAGGYTDQRWYWHQAFDGITSINLKTGETKVTGAYPAQRSGPYLETVKPGMFIRRKAEHIHRVLVPAGKTAWTLIATSPYSRDWSFITKNGPVYWRTYLDVPPAVDVGE
jgi:hypothetical protein